jgi:hypothetical protein
VAGSPSKGAEAGFVEDARGKSGRDQPFAGALVALEYLFAVELKKAVPAKDVFRCLGFVLGMS